MHTEHSFERRDRRPRPPFNRRNNRHPGLAERDYGTREIPKPKGEIPEAFASTVFGQINPLIQHAVTEEGYDTPTPIQDQSIPALLEGRDLLGCAQTGTGKTAAFLLPILHRLLAQPIPTVPGRPRALILAPTRELAAQIAESVATYGRYTGLPFAVVFGGVSQYPQVQALRRGAVLVVATPGRLLDLMEQRHLTLDTIEEFVLDEADRMLDMGFLPDIKKILAKLPIHRHSQFFSATLSAEVLRFAQAMVVNPVQVTIEPDKPTVDKIHQRVMFVDKPNKIALLAHLFKIRPEMTKVIIFSRTRHGADKIVSKLMDQDIPADAIHSDKTQRARTDALAAFKHGRFRALVATDIASRGIDVDDVSHVINFDLPEETESYVHRIGRTARAGASGSAISLVSAEERGLLKAVERMIKKSIEVDRVEEFHSERAEKAAGRGVPDSLPRPDWAGKKRVFGSGSRDERRSKQFRDRTPSHEGRMQADFRADRDDVAGGTPKPEVAAERPPRPARPPRPERPAREERAHVERKPEAVPQYVRKPDPVPQYVPKTDDRPRRFDRDERPAPRPDRAERAPRRDRDAAPSAARGTETGLPSKRPFRGDERPVRGDKPVRKPGERVAPKGPDVRKHEGEERKGGTSPHVKHSPHPASKARHEEEEAKPAKSSSPFAKFFRGKK
jgi:ATP-dependent RNA helicase RhlE